VNQLGYKLVAVGTGNRFFAKGFIEALPWTGSVLLDPQANAFKAANLPRWGLGAVIWRFFMGWSVLSFGKKLKAKHPKSNMEGDGLQSGGVYVLGKGDKTDVLFEFREADNPVDVFADNEAILAACRAYSEKHKLPPVTQDPPPPIELPPKA